VLEKKGKKEERGSGLQSAPYVYFLASMRKKEKRKKRKKRRRKEGRQAVGAASPLETLFIVEKKEGESRPALHVLFQSHL